MYKEPHSVSATVDSVCVAAAFLQLLLSSLSMQAQQPAQEPCRDPYSPQTNNMLYRRNS